MNVYGSLATWAAVAITCGALALWGAILVTVCEAIDRMTEIMPRKKK